MTLTHEAMLKDTIAKATLESPLVVPGSVDKYKHRKPCQLRIDTLGSSGKCLAKRDFRLNGPDYDFLRDLCRAFNDNDDKHKSAVLNIYPC